MKKYVFLLLKVEKITTEERKKEDNINISSMIISLLKFLCRIGMIFFNKIYKNMK